MLKVYEVEVIAGQRPLRGPLADPRDAFIARCVQAGPRLTPEGAKRLARADLLTAGAGGISWVNVTACRRRPDIEVESEELLEEMLSCM